MARDMRRIYTARGPVSGALSGLMRVPALFQYYLDRLDNWLLGYDYTVSACKGGRPHAFDVTFCFHGSKSVPHCTWFRGGEVIQHNIPIIVSRRRLRRPTRGFHYWSAQRRSE